MCLIFQEQLDWTGCVSALIWGQMSEPNKIRLCIIYSLHAFLLQIWCPYYCFVLFCRQSLLIQLFNIKLNINAQIVLVLLILTQLCKPNKIRPCIIPPWCILLCWVIILYDYTDLIAEILFKNIFSLHWCSWFFLTIYLFRYHGVRSIALTIPEYTKDTRSMCWTAGVCWSYTCFIAPPKKHVHTEYQRMQSGP